LPTILFDKDNIFWWKSVIKKGATEGEWAGVFIIGDRGPGYGCETLG